MHDPECMVINGSDVAWSCVVDDTPEIWSSIVPWLATAIGLAGIKPALIHIHHVCSLRREVADLCRELEVNTHAIEPFDPRYPHTNKIRQCTTDFMGVRRVVLTDVDVAFAKPLRSARSRLPSRERSWIGLTLPWISCAIYSPQLGYRRSESARTLMSTHRTCFRNSKHCLETTMAACMSSSANTWGESRDVDALGALASRERPSAWAMDETHGPGLVLSRSKRATNDRRCTR